jgi:hypothetical protein
MLHWIYELIQLVEAKPLTTAAVAVVVVLYMNLMMSGPRAH